MRQLFATLSILLALGLPVCAQSPSVVVNGLELESHEGWIEDGTSYVTLRGLARVMEGTSISWDGAMASFEGAGFLLTAQPGAQYIEVNDRALYHPEGVAVPNGYTALPLRLVAEALEGSAVWNGTYAELTTGQPDNTQDSYDQDVLYWLSAIISAESRGEPLVGQIAVGNVVLNRLSHWRYPDTIYGVIFDDNYGVQFEPVSNGTIYLEPAEQSVSAAKLSLEGAEVVGDCLYFFSPALSEGTWIRQNTQYVTTIGCHQFYRDWS